MESKGKQIIIEDSSSKGFSIFKKKNRNIDEIEEIFDVESQLENFRTGNISKIKPERIFKRNWNLLKNEKLFSGYIEKTVSCVNEDKQEEVGLISSETLKNIKRNFKIAHLGAIIVGVKSLTRGNLGAKTLVAFIDKRFTNVKQGLLASYEIDMNNKGGITYFIPDFSIKTEDLNQICVGIKTKGYQMKSDKENLLVCVRNIHRFNNSGASKTKISQENFNEILGSKGVKAIPALKQSSEINAGLEWKIEGFFGKELLIPENNIIYENTNGSLSLRFTNYRKGNIETVSNLEQETDDETEGGFMALITEDLQDEIDELEEMIKNAFSEEVKMVFRKRIAEIKGEEIQQESFQFEEIKMADRAESSATHNPPSFPQSTIDTEMIRGPRAYRPSQIIPNETVQWQGMGKRRPIEHIMFPKASNEGTILNIGYCNVQDWDDAINIWQQDLSRTWMTLSNREELDMFAYLETFLGETAKNLWTVAKNEKQEEIARARSMGDNPENFANLIRRLFMGFVPQLDNTFLQDNAMMEIENLQIKDFSYIEKYTQDWLRAIGKTGDPFNDNLSDRYFQKLPGDLGREIWRRWQELKAQGTIPDKLGIGPRAVFTYNILQEKCRKIQIDEQVKRQSFAWCKKTVYTPQVYEPPKKRIGFRKTQNKPNKNQHVKKTENAARKCYCFICGDPGHFARECKSRTQRGNIANTSRSQLFEAIEEDIQSVSSDSDNDSIYSIELIEDIGMMAITDCNHEWILGMGNISIKCKFCIYKPTLENRYYCRICTTEICKICIKQQFNIDHIDPPKRRTVRMEEELLKIKIQNLELRVEKLENIVKIKDKKGKEIIIEEDVENIYEEGLKAESFQIIKPVQEALYTNRARSACIIQIRVHWNKYEYIDIPALIDTGCTQCTFPRKIVPNWAIKQSSMPTNVITMEGNTVKSTEELIPGITIQYHLLGDKLSNPICLPKTWIHNFHHEKIEAIIGQNLITQNNGGMFFSKDYIIFCSGSKFVPTQHFEITSELLAKRGGHNPHKIQKFEKIEEQEEIFSCEELEDFYPDEDRKKHIQALSFEIKDKGLIEIINSAEKLGFIGQDPTIAWEGKKKERFIIINPDLTIRTSAIPYTPNDVREFEVHIKELLKMKLIRQSKSPHRSAAFFVNNHNEQIRGKARLVINYIDLNKNIQKDGYTLPGIDILLNQIQGRKVFSKLDCKSGYYQIPLEEDSIPWTAMSTSQGLYEWVVLPFGIKTAPSIFQRFMDQTFQDYKDFCLCYIDDILIFSDNIQEHRKHLKMVFERIIDAKIVISKKKMELERKEVSFLGQKISTGGKIMLQPHISQKMLNVDPKTLCIRKNLQAFLGSLNYARPYIKDLAKLVRPLYAKLEKKGNLNFSKTDFQIVNKLFEAVRNIPSLELPKTSDYKIIEVDGSQEAWGAILKCRPNKFSLKNEERICRFESGCYRAKNLSSLDYEILAVINSLNKFRLYILGQPFLIRTDCQAIVKFAERKREKSISQNRWLSFKDTLINGGYEVSFEHIKGEDNTLADALSRKLLNLVKTPEYLLTNQFLDEQVNY